MASISVTDTNHTRVTVKVSGLQEARENYDKFVYRFTQNGKQIMAYVYDWATGSYTSWEFEFSNDNYLGNNNFAPATTYSVQVDCYYNGVAYTVGPVTFTTDSISPPTGTITPTVYPTVKDQGPYGNCVAMSLSTAMEIFKAKRMGAGNSYENFSVSYIFGSDGRSNDDMLFEGAIGLCEAYGSPRWELVTTAFPDSKSKSASRSLFSGACGLANNNAQKQAFTGHENIDFYDCAAVASAIRNHGYFMMNFRIPNNFYNIPSSGVVPQPSGGYAWGNHSLALIGLTTINGKKHWIAQNGWGASWGQGGRCYIPYDWGCGLQSPQGASNQDQACGWTCECYSVWNSNVASNNPGRPTITDARQDRPNTTATIQWNTSTASASTILYARKRGTTDWWPKPSYGSPFTGTSGQISFDRDTTTYEVMAISVWNNLLSAQSQVVTVSISLLEPWSWTTSNGSASAAATKAAYAAVTKKGPTTDFSYIVWNDLVDKVNEAVVAAGSSWSTLYATFPQTKMTASDRAPTAKRFNALRQNIGSHISTGISEVSSGDVIKGNYFVILADKLNQWIGNL